MKLSNFPIVAEHRSQLVGLNKAMEVAKRGNLRCVGDGSHANVDFIDLLGQPAIRAALCRHLEIRIGEEHRALETYGVEIDE